LKLTGNLDKAVGTTAISPGACGNVGKVMDAQLQINKYISSLEVTEQIRNKLFKPSKTTSDLDLEPARLEHGFCISSLLAEHLTKVS
jgi:hypothetical protein